MAASNSAGLAQMVVETRRKKMASQHRGREIGIASLLSSTRYVVKCAVTSERSLATALVNLGCEDFAEEPTLCAGSKGVLFLACNRCRQRRFRASIPLLAAARRLDFVAVVAH